RARPSPVPVSTRADPDYRPAARVASSDGSSGWISPGASTSAGTFSVRCLVIRTLAATAATASRLTPKVRIRPPALWMMAGRADRTRHMISIFHAVGPRVGNVRRHHDLRHFHNARTAPDVTHQIGR